MSPVYLSQQELADRWRARRVEIKPLNRQPADRQHSGGNLAFVCEAYAVDGESVVDLVAWLLSEPETPLSMFGRCGLLGLWLAMAPGTYFMGGSLRLHRTPLKWLQAGCDGAAVVDPHLAGQELLAAPGRIVAEDQVHGREIVKLLRAAAAIDNKVIAPTPNRRAA